MKPLNPSEARTPAIVGPGVSAECIEARQGSHIQEDHFLPEIIDPETGEALPPGSEGELVLTPLTKEALPLLRYRTGDCAALYLEPCRCGRTTPRLGPIVGRKSQKLKVKGSSLFPSTLTTVLEQTAGVESFVIVARKESDLSDSIEVLVHCSASTAALRDALQARAKTTPLIRHASLSEIETLQMPPQARKRRTFVDLR